MREIKFRAWSKDNGCWSGAFCVHNTMGISDLIDAHIDEDSGSAISDAHWGENDLQLSQYTGLKDKNSVEIYEGDIIRYKHPKYDKDYNISIVKYSEELCGFTINCKYFSSLDSAIDYLEVIGNIYENPELLK